MEASLEAGGNRLQLEGTPDCRGMRPHNLVVPMCEKNACAEGNIIKVCLPNSCFFISLFILFQIFTLLCITFQEETPQPMYIVPRLAFRDFFRFLIQKPIFDAISRTEKKLPVVVSVRMHPTQHAIAMGTLTSRSLASDEEIQEALGIELMKTFRLGSYAVIKSPVIVSYNEKKGNTQISINYEVRSHANVLLWPVRYDL